MNKISRLAGWVGIALAMLVAAPAAASAATARPMNVCPASFEWQAATQSCVYVG